MENWFRWGMFFLFFIGLTSCERENSIEEQIIISGRICEGTQLAEWTGALAEKRMRENCTPIVNARVVLQNSRGQVIKVNTDFRGCFSVGPLLISGDEKDKILFTDDNHAGLSVSELKPDWANGRPVQIELPIKPECPFKKQTPP